MKYFVKEWESLTSDPAILSIVFGLEIEFVDNAHPGQVTVPRQIPFNTQEAAAVSKDKKVIRSVKPCNGQFVSSMFVPPKPDENFRMILNLKGLYNVVYHHFKMDT